MSDPIAFKKKCIPKRPPFPNITPEQLKERRCHHAHAEKVMPFRDRIKRSKYNLPKNAIVKAAGLSVSLAWDLMVSTTLPSPPLVMSRTLPASASSLLFRRERSLSKRNTWPRVFKSSAILASRKKKRWQEL